MAERMVSLIRSQADRQNQMESAISEGLDLPDVHSGLMLELDDHALEMLSLDPDGVEKGDLVHLHVMVQVTRIDSHNGEFRIGGAIIAGCVEDESTEGTSDGDE